MEKSEICRQRKQHQEKKKEIVLSSGKCEMQ